MFSPVDASVAVPGKAMTMIRRVLMASVLTVTLSTIACTGNDGDIADIGWVFLRLC
jgi:hypothetical protein